MSAAERATELSQLRERLEARFGRAILPVGGVQPAAEPVAGLPTGLHPLDRLLPGGVPRGALSLWTGETTSGRTAALRSLVERTCSAGAAVALVDASRTLDATFGCTPAGPLPGLWVARPPEGRTGEGAWAAEALLRAGAFELVVLDGECPDHTQAHRLRGLARETDTALLVSVESAPTHGWRADVRLGFRRVGTQAGGLEPGGRFRRRVQLHGGGPGRGEREVELVHTPANRLHPGPPAADRRGR